MKVLRSNPFVVSVLSCLLFFSLTVAAFATTWPGHWPDCGWVCWDYGPDGSQSNPDSCGNCCSQNCLAGGGNGQFDYAGCVACCNAYNYGDPNGNTHCQGHGPITTAPVIPIDPPDPQ